MANLSSGSRAGSSVIITYKMLLNAIKTIDGHNSGIDADLLDGHHADYFSPTTHLHDNRYLQLTGGTMTGDILMDVDQSKVTTGIKLIVNTQLGGWARGFAYYKSTDPTNNKMAGIGAFSDQGNSVKHLFMGFGNGWEDSDKGIKVYPDRTLVNGSRVITTIDEGHNKGFDADTVDGYHATHFATSDHNHDDIYLKLSGGTMTGMITTPNNTAGIQLGDDVQLCDGNVANHMVLQGAQNPGLGGITFGSSKDTNIYRGGNNLLKTDDIFNAVGGLQWNGQSLDIRYTDRNLLLNNGKIFTVGGDANKYYPVLINNGHGNSFSFSKISISRLYSAPAPDTWNNSTHKGGLTLTMLWTGDNSWGGGDKTIQVLEFNETYSTMVGGLGIATTGLIVWLRGGNAQYRLDTEFGQAASVSVNLADYTDSGNNVFAVRNNNSQAAADIGPKFCNRNGELYDKNVRVYSPNNKPTPADIGAVNKSGDTMTGDLIVGTTAINTANIKVQSSTAFFRVLANDDSKIWLQAGIGANGGNNFGKLEISGINAMPLGTFNVNSSVSTINGNIIWHAGNDGSGTGLDADLLDGLHASSFLRSDANSALNYGKSLDISHVNSSGSRFNPNGKCGICGGIDAADSRNANLRLYSWFGIGLVNTCNADSTVPQYENATWFNVRRGHIYTRGDIFAQSSQKVWHQGNDGSGSGLDADLLDGYHHDAFVKKAGDTMTGRLNLPSNRDNGIRIGNVTIDQVSTGELVMRSLKELRFGSSDAWAYDSWGGIKYDTSACVMYIGGPGGVFGQNNGTNIDINLRNKVKAVLLPATNVSDNIIFGNTETGLNWSMNTDFAKIYFKNTGDSDTDSYLHFLTGDNGNEYMKFSIQSGSSVNQIMTIKSEGVRVTKLWGAVYNDYAEYFEKGEEIEPGDVVVLKEDSDKEEYVKCTEAYSSFVVGVCSDEFFQCIGGNGDGKDEENFTPIGLAGRVKVKLVGKAKKGDLLTSSNIPGVAMVADNPKMGTIIGKCLEDKDTEEIERTRMLIQLS